MAGLANEAVGHLRAEELWLALRGVPRSMWAYPILPQSQTIGRSNGCPIRVGDHIVSREHAVVWHDASGCHIRDLQSANGTHVNGQRVEETSLSAGDVIQIGTVTLQVVSTPQEETSIEAGGTLDRSTELVSDGGQAAVAMLPSSAHRHLVRDDIAALYSLGGCLGTCAERMEMVQHVLEWVCQWVGISFAAAIHRDGTRLRIVATSGTRGREPATDIHWLTVEECIRQKGTVLWEVGSSSAPQQPGTSSGSKQVIGAWIPGIEHDWVIYGHDTSGQKLLAIRHRKLLDVAADVLAKAMDKSVTTGRPPPPRSRVTGLAEEYVLVGGDTLQPLLRLIDQAAAADVTVLITGETGTGKELVARAIHQRSRRADKPFVARNCGAFTESLLESELFGHEAGAFTGATKRRKGIFEQAEGGTLLLDEIGDTSLALQSKILRVLEERAFQRVGGDQMVRADLRIIAATNRDLARAVAEGDFRRDLYYRLQVLTIDLPPLRERMGDIRCLAKHFLELARQRLDLADLELAEEAVQKLEGHNWPGNVRELRYTIERAAILSEGGRIDANHILLAQSPDTPILSHPVAARLEDLERERILQVLASVGGNKAKAASILGIDRTTLHRKLKRLGS